MKWFADKIFSVYHFFWSLLGAAFFSFPSERLFVLGVTGTKGKSTVLELINAVLEAAGRKTALLSSIRIKIGERNQKNYLGNTMPGRVFIQEFLRQAVKNKCDFALIEVTSQGVLQHRHRFINWDAALFTNLAPEHIEAHGGFEKYRETKLSFFMYVKKLRISNFKFQISKQAQKKLFFVNQDDLSARYFIEASKSSNSKIILYSKNKIEGKFQPPCFMFQENIAAAVSFCQAIGVDGEIIKKTIENFPGVPGRMEIIQVQPFVVIIDYAHTPDSLEKVYKTIHNSKFVIPNSKMICVLGSAGGGRDKWKRQKMGEIAAKYCDEIVLTDEDSYDENPLQIIDEIESGIRANLRLNPRQSASVYKIIDRKEAIKKALFLAKDSDVIVITGKGCEPWLHLAKGVKLHWDERKIVEETIRQMDSLDILK